MAHQNESLGVKMTISEAIRQLRYAHDESQQVFSNRLHMSKASVAHYEGGSRIPDGVATMRLYSAAVDIGRDDLAAVFGNLMKQRMDQGGMGVTESGEIEYWKMILRDAEQRKKLMKFLAPGAMTDSANGTK
jgi:transcriptional regulator with XRE-family HTH domain